MRRFFLIENTIISLSNIKRVVFSPKDLNVVIEYIGDNVPISVSMTPAQYKIIRSELIPEHQMSLSCPP